MYSGDIAYLPGVIAGIFFYSGRFITLEDARAHVETLVAGYNNEQRRSGIKFVAPTQRHRREDEGILHHRK